MACFALGRIAEQSCDIRIPFDVGLPGEVQVTAIGLRFAREGIFQIVVSLTPFESCHFVLLYKIGYFGRLAAPARFSPWDYNFAESTWRPAPSTQSGGWLQGPFHRHRGNIQKT